MATAWTIRALMEWTEKHFQQKGFESPRLEAQLLLAHALECRRVELYTRWDEVIQEDRRSRFRELVQRRLEGCPAMYLVGRREFYTLDFEVTPAVLIPRPETELLVTEALKKIRDISEPRVLDVGTGSGCIAVAIAHRSRNAQVTAIDVSAEALAVARRNAERHGVAERIQFSPSDLFGGLAENAEFDVIASNPPYVSRDEFERLAEHVQNFEPKLALDGGDDGFAVYDRLIPGARKHLRAGGWLLLEIGASQEAGIRERLEKSGYLIERFQRDDSGLPRLAIAQKKD